jgi:hypothetical protein
MVGSQDAIRKAVLGGAIGAASGAVLVAGLFAGSLGLHDTTTISGDLAPWVTAIVLVIVSQFAVAGGLCGFALREAAR